MARAAQLALPRPGSLRGPELAPGAVGSAKLALPSSGGGYIAATFTTTDTTQWVRAASGTMLVPGLGQYIIGPVHLQISHSVADARYGIYFSVYTTADFSGSNYVTFLHGLTIGKALALPRINGDWQALNVTGILYADVWGIAPGTRAVDLAVRNYDAGTLSVAAGDGYDFASWEFKGYKPG